MSSDKMWLCTLNNLNDHFDVIEIGVNGELDLRRDDAEGAYQWYLCHKDIHIRHGYKDFKDGEFMFVCNSFLICEAKTIKDATDIFWKKREEYWDHVYYNPETQIISDDNHLNEDGWVKWHEYRDQLAKEEE